MKVLNEMYKLANGVEIPKIGFGTWQIENGKLAYDSVMLALKHGYRHIDTAAAYHNEESVGKAVHNFGLARKEVFVTSKLQSDIKTYEGTKKAFQKTLDELGFDYLDLYLIHAPRPWDKNDENHDEGNVEAFRAMIELYEAGKIRSIGVSNFASKDIDNIIKHLDFVPHVNQIAFFAGLNEKEIRQYCKKHNILVEAYSPLAVGKALKIPVVIDLAKKYERTPAQILIRYCLEKETLPLPKSVHESRIIENSKVDFQMSKEDVETLEKIKDDPRKWN